MRWLSSLACAAVIAGATAAKADTIASPPIFGGLSQTVAVCYIFNSGTTNISISSLVIWSDLGTGLVEPKCPTPLVPGGTCSKLVTIARDRAYSCRVTLTGKASARGSIEIRDSSANVLNRADLR
jgi:hypothetical protein